MGFSPGDFMTVDGKKLHFERKGYGLIVLWPENEIGAVFEIDLANAEIIISQLQTLLVVDV